MSRRRLGYASGPIVLDRLLRDVPAIGAIAGSLATAALLYAPFVPAAWSGHATTTAIGAMLTLAVVCTAGAFVLFFALIAEIGPSRATVITYINPVVAVALGMLLLDEPLTVEMMVGFPLVIVGSIMGTVRDKEADLQGESPETRMN